MPQPVDFQTEVAKVSAAERAQQIAGRVSLAAQQRDTSGEQETRIAAETQVQQTAHTENLEVDAEGHRKNPFAGRRRRRSKGDEASGERDASGGGNRSADGEERHKLDVTI